MALVEKSCQSIALSPPKEVACVPPKEVANVSPHKELAIMPNKEVALMPNKEIALIPCNLPSLPWIKISSACLTCKMTKLPRSVQEFIEEKAKICEPDSIYICDGSEEEYQTLMKKLQESGMIQKLEKMKNWFVFKFILVKIYFNPSII